MNLELHILQNFAPANLNRDDTGSPKSCDFGGVRRARISSQAIKHAIRREFKDADLIPEGERAIRSKRFVDEIAKRLVAAGREAELAAGVAEAGLGLLDIKLAKDQKTQYLLYLAPQEIAAITSFCDSQWDALATMAAGDKKSKKDAKDDEAKALGKRLVDSLDGGKAADLALFGRMLADLPERNIDAASQVAHAISTHQVNLDFDYYTAVDQLRPEDTAGADMIGTVEFNSACYYRYANIDLGQLRKNLGGDADLAAAAVKAFLTASRDAIPTGKQNSFAAHNPPSLVFAVLRNRGAWSLANAFVRPVRATGDSNLGQESAAALDGYWGELTEMYGEPVGTQLSVCALSSIDLGGLAPHRVGTFAELSGQVMAGVAAGLAG